MIEAVGNVKGQFFIDTVVAGAFTQGAFHIDEQVAGCSPFAGNRFTAEADDIRGAVFSKKLTICLCDAVIIRQQQGDLIPDSVRVGSLQADGQFSAKPANCRQIQRAFLLIPYGCFHLLDRQCARAACW